MTEQPKKRLSDLAILGINVLIFAVYTILFLSAGPDGGAMAFFCSVFHFVVVTIVAIAVKRWAWFLGGIVVIVIGFGTCVNNFHLGNMH